MWAKRPCIHPNDQRSPSQSFSDPGTAFKFKTTQGAFSTTTFTGTGNALQSFNVPVKGGVFLDQFNVKVSINDNKWKQYSSLYDIPLEGQGYLVMSGINEGIDIYFGNSNFGKVPPPGSFIKVEYLQTSGSLGNLRSTSTSKITYKFFIKRMPNC